MTARTDTGAEGSIQRLHSPAPEPGGYAAPMLLLAAIILAANLNALSAGFVWDDGSLILSNSLIRHWSSLPALFTHTFLSGYYRPVVFLSLAADHAIWGAKPFGYHLVNLLLHIVNTWLVFLLLKRVSGSRFAALLGGLLFAAHPVHKGVVYISDRTGMLAAFFFLAALFFYFSYRGLRKSGRAWAYYAGAVMFCGLATFSKEEALTLPLVLVMTDIFFFADNIKEKPIRQVASYAPFFLLPAFYLWIRAAVVQAPVGLVKAFLIEPVRRLLTIPFLLLDYLALLAFPLRLDYDPLVSLIRSAGDIRVWTGIGAIAVAVLAGLWLFKKNRTVSYGIFWFLVVFIPMSNLIPIFPELAGQELFAPVHFLYLPSVGIFLCAGIGLEKLSSNLGKNSVSGFGKRGLRLAVISILLFFCLLSQRRNNIWKNELNLFGYIVRMHPDRVSLRPNLAYAYLHAGNVEEAIRRYREAVELSPDSSEIHNGLGVAYLTAGLVEPAIREFRRSIELKPGDPDPYTHLGVAFAERGLLTEAEAATGKAVAMAPSVPRYRVNLGLVLIRMGEFERARQQFAKVLVLSPNDREARDTFAWLSARTGEPDQAEDRKKQETAQPNAVREKKAVDRLKSSEGSTAGPVDSQPF